MRTWQGLAEKDTNVTGVPKKRNALGDVTNNSKAASTSRGGVGGSKPAAKPTTTTAPAISRRTSRSRLRQDEDGDALMADSALPAAPPAQDASSSSRPIKALRSNARKPDDTKAPAASRRAGALTEKSNNRVAGGKSSRPTTATAKSKAERLAQLEETVRAAQAELERARREAEADDGVDSVEEEQHAAKRLRTSEPDRQASVADEDEDDYEVARRADEEDQARTAEKTRAKDEGWVDLDDGDEEDPLMVSTYVVEIYDYLRELEVSTHSLLSAESTTDMHLQLKTLPDSGYMERQEDLTFRMRAILMDWLVEVHGKFRLLPETIFLAQNLVDRFLSVRSVAISKFQLVGVTALFTAAKFEEVICPSVNNFMYMTDGGYEDDEILRAERHMLREVNFDLSYPNPINFLRRISKADGYDIQSRTFAKYFMEIAIVDETLYYVKPSLLAAAAVWLARKVLERGHWVSGVSALQPPYRADKSDAQHANLVHYSGYAQEELLETAQKMYNYLQRNSGLSNGTVYKRSVDDVTETITGAEPLELEHPNFFKKYSARKVSPPAFLRLASPR